MKLKPFKTYTIGGSVHTLGYTIAFPVESKTTTTRGGMTGTMLVFTGWIFYPAHAGGKANTHSKFGAQALEYEYLEDIETYKWDINEQVEDDQKQDMIMEVFKYYKDR